MTDRITQLLDDVQRLDEQATKGPWIIDSIESGEHALFVDEDNPGYGHLGATSSTVASFLLAKNADFIALARTFAPAASRALRDVLETLDQYLVKFDQDNMEDHIVHGIVQELRNKIRDQFRGQE